MLAPLLSAVSIAHITGQVFVESSLIYLTLWWVTACDSVAWRHGFKYSWQRERVDSLRWKGKKGGIKGNVCVQKQKTNVSNTPRISILVSAKKQRSWKVDDTASQPAVQVLISERTPAWQWSRDSETTHPTVWAVTGFSSRTPATTEWSVSWNTGKVECPAE